jgi:hypothetical protein
VTPSELLSDAPYGLFRDERDYLFARIFCHYLADHATSLELESGLPVRDATDQRLFLEQLAEAMVKEKRKVAA